ncbi:phage tail fiber protein [Nocardia sp. CA-290969]|uniref:phage tail fiber protein n=1 Tax=Nocardia sp. CA-290969 TaxID=3239986 RepID=UPI003D8AE98C
MVGVSVPNVANPTLDWLRGVAPPPVAGIWAKLHIGDPGANGTAQASAVTTRVQVTLNAASGGSMTLSSVSGSWSMTATENITHISLHDDPTAGNFLASGVLDNPRPVASGDTLTLIKCTVATTTPAT